MLRYAFTMKLRPGAYPKYKQMHDEIWPELVEVIESAGCVTMSIFESGPERLFLYSEVTDEGAWDKIRSSEVHQRWGEALRDCFVLNDKGEPDLGEWNEMFTLGRAARDG